MARRKMSSLTAQPANARDAACQHVEDSVIDLPGVSLPVRLYGQRASAAGAPLVVHFHGGAFTSGTLDCGTKVAHLLCKAGARVVSVAYPLAPECRFPASVDAAYEALVWAAAKRNRLAGPGARVFVAGEEAGGNLAAVMAMMSRDRHKPELAGQILISPMLDPCMATASLREAGVGQPGCTWAEGWKRYLRDVGDADHPYASPSASTRLGHLPPALVLTTADDPLRDEALCYAHRLKGAGVPVTEVVLACGADWPGALMEGDAAELDSPCAWAERSLEHLRRFMHAVPEMASAKVA